MLAPAAYLVTDPAGLIREANLRAVALLGIDHRFVSGKPLVSFVAADDRMRFRTASPAWPVRRPATGGPPSSPGAATRSR